MAYRSSLRGEVPDWHWLAHRTAEEITGVGIRLLLEHTAQMIDPLNHVVTVVERNGQAEQLRYDRLVIATVIGIPFIVRSISRFVPKTVTPARLDGAPKGKSS